MPTDPNAPLTFLSLVRTNGGKHQTASPVQLWERLQANVAKAGIENVSGMTPFTGEAKLAIMGEAKGYGEIARFSYICSQDGLDVETIVGFTPDVAEQQVRQLSGAGASR